MADITVKRIEDSDSPNGGGFCRAQAALGVTSFGMQVENFPPHFELLALGAVPGRAYAAPAFTEEGAALPG
jgi:hypothetical protein